MALAILSSRVGDGAQVVELGGDPRPGLSPESVLSFPRGLSCSLEALAWPRQHCKQVRSPLTLSVLTREWAHSQRADRRRSSSQYHQARIWAEGDGAGPNQNFQSFPRKAALILCFERDLFQTFCFLKCILLNRKTLMLRLEDRGEEGDRRMSLVEETSSTQQT